LTVDDPKEKFFSLNDVTFNQYLRQAWDREKMCNLTAAGNTNVSGAVL
jgi:hypothetical protein